LIHSRWVLVWNVRHLDRVLTEYVAHYYSARRHRGLGLDVPMPAPAADPCSGRVERIEVLGGLIHEYLTLGAGVVARLALRDLAEFRLRHDRQPATRCYDVLPDAADAR
jgi:hypothetical protein